ncbi:MAG TPA: Ig-like domain-containing protein [Polyangia bacterium]|nr:Ig-like domain-containing protein [Polyangia bacterium]
MAPVPTTVSITAPLTTVYTNASVTISISTSRPTTATTTLVATAPYGTQNIGTITAPQTSFTWNTTGVREATYSVTAQLTVGGTTATSNAITIVVDRTPPHVVVSSLIPAPGATNVVLAAPIQATFSEPVLASTVTAPTIPIYNSRGSAVPTTASLSADGYTVAVTLSSDQGVTLDQTFSGSFTHGITDLAGNPLQDLSTTWSWTVPAWIKYAPITSGLNATLLLAVTTNNQPVVAYNICQTVSGGGCLPLLHVAVSDGQAWNDLGLVVSGIAANGCALFLDATNNPTIAWGKSPSSGTAQVVFSTWSGTAWVTTTYPVIDLTAAGSTVGSIAVALDSMRRPVVAYRSDIYSPTTSSEIYVAAWTGTAWDTSYGAVGDSNSSTFDLVLGAGEAPIVTVADNDTTSGAYLWSGTSWSFSGGSNSPNASASTDTAGNPIMLSTAGNWIPYHLTGGTWLPFTSAPVPVSPGYSTNPTLTADATHRPVVAWSSTYPTTTGIGLFRSLGTSWDTRPGYASGGAAANNWPPQVTVDQLDNMWLGWTEGSTVYVWMSNY